MHNHTHGAINDISVLDPLPGVVGLTKVVSIRVHFSPLSPQPPGKIKLMIYGRKE